MESKDDGTITIFEKCFYLDNIFIHLLHYLLHTSYVSFFRIDINIYKYI